MSEEHDGPPANEYLREMFRRYGSKPISPPSQDDTAAPIEQRIREAAERIARDVAELDYTSPEDAPEIMQCTADELMAILQPVLLAIHREALEEIAEVDKLIAVYGIDTCGTGPRATKKEQARVDRIVDAAIGRHRARHLASPAPKECPDCGGTKMTRWLGRDNSEEVGPCYAPLPHRRRKDE